MFENKEFLKYIRDRLGFVFDPEDKTKLEHWESFTENHEIFGETKAKINLIYKEFIGEVKIHSYSTSLSDLRKGLTIMPLNTEAQVSQRKLPFIIRTKKKLSLFD